MILLTISQEQVLAVIEGNPYISPNEIKAKMNLSFRTIVRALAALRIRQLIKKVPDPFLRDLRKASYIVTRERAETRASTISRRLNE